MLLQGINTCRLCICILVLLLQACKMRSHNLMDFFFHSTPAHIWEWCLITIFVIHMHISIPNFVMRFLLSTFGFNFIKCSITEIHSLKLHGPRRCTFLNWVQKFVQVVLHNGVKARWSETRAAQGFHHIKSFISNIFGPNFELHEFFLYQKNVHLKALLYCNFASTNTSWLEAHFRFYR